MDTTHPAGSAFEVDRARWERSIQDFSSGIEFAGLKIVESGVEGNEGRVTFRATLLHGGKDASFTEHSRFLREDGRWLYHSGTIE
jgi:SEC-C motif-containing protein